MLWPSRLRVGYFLGLWRAACVAIQWRGAAGGWSRAVQDFEAPGSETPAFSVGARAGRHFARFAWGGVWGERGAREQAHPLA